MEKYIASNQLLRCFSGDAFLFIDSVIFTVKGRFADWHTSLKKYTVQSQCDVEWSSLWTLSASVHTERTYKPLWIWSPCLIIFIHQLSLRFSERLHAAVQLVKSQGIWQFHLWYLLQDFPADLHFSTSTRELSWFVLKSAERRTKKTLYVSSYNLRHFQKILWINK